MPSLPGVYWFLDGNGDVLYVGKAKVLKNRLTQYARKQDDRPQIDKLLSQVNSVRFQILQSEVEALLVEAELIRRYQPSFNILLKDDKSNLYICIGPGEFPRVFTARKAEVLHASEKWTTFGPFQSGYKVRQVMEIARRIFKWCEKPLQRQQATDYSTKNNTKRNNPVASELSPVDLKHNARPCFYYHLGLCTGACTGKVSAPEYEVMIGNLKQFLRGKTSELVKQFKAEIEVLSEEEHFEKAAIVRDQLDALITVTSPKYRLRPDMTIPVLTDKMEEEALVSFRSVLRQYLSLPANTPIHRIEGYDISNIQGTNASCSMVVAIDGVMTNSEYKHFGIKTLNTPNDFAMLKEALTRRQNHPEWGMPDVLLIDGGKGQLRSVLSIWNWQTVVVSIAKKPDRLIIPIIGRKAFGKSHLAAKESPKSNAQGPMSISYKEIELTPDLPATRLLQSIRDESHRFAKRLHKIKRDKDMILS